MQASRHLTRVKNKKERNRFGDGGCDGGPGVQPALSLCVLMQLSSAEPWASKG